MASSSSSDAATLTLVVAKGPRMGHTVECQPGRRVRIGRAVHGNTLTIKDAGISQSHLSIEATAEGGGTWMLTDLASSNGTLLNDAPVDPSAPAALRDGDTIKIGEETAIRVQIATAAAAPVPPAAVPLRRNPRRGCAAGTTAEPPPVAAAGGGTRRTGRSKRTANAERVPAVPDLDSADLDVEDTDGRDDVGHEGKTNLTTEESAKGQRKKVSASRRGKSAPKKAAAAAPRVLDSVSEEFENEEVEVNGDHNALKEVKQEMPDSVRIQSVKGMKAGIRKGKEAARGDTEQVKVEEKRVGPVREEEDIGGAIPSVGGRVDMESMTLEEWFDRMEEYLPKVINEIAEEIILEIKATAEKFKEHVGNSLDCEQGHMEERFFGLT